MTQFINIIGYPLKHTVSPDFQQAALDYYHLDARYEARETKPSSLSSVINQLKQPQYLGANVTIPYKEMVLSLLDEVDDLARFAGAVNTIVNRAGKLLGFNTDAYGFLKALREDAKLDPRNKRAIVLGAGGAARAVSFVLLREGVDSVTITNRTLARAESLVLSLKEYAAANGLYADIAVSSWQTSMLRKAIMGCHLIVNCTALGMRHSAHEGQSPLLADLISKGALVYDLVYNPIETPLLRIAKEAGANVIGGLHMLVYQGAASFKLWTGREAPLDIMLSVAKQALLKEGG